MVNDFDFSEEFLDMSEDAQEVAADLNAEILDSIEYQEEGYLRELDLEAIIIEAIDNFLRQYNGKVTRHDIFSDDEIHNKLAEAHTSEEVKELVPGFAGAVALYLEDNGLI